MNREVEKDIITRLVLVEKSPFVVSYIRFDTGEEEEYKVKNSNFFEEYYIIMDGKHMGSFIQKRLCSKIHISE
jgi:hypothetical protein